MPAKPYDFDVQFSSGTLKPTHPAAHFGPGMVPRNPPLIAPSFTSHGVELEVDGKPGAGTIVQALYVAPSIPPGLMVDRVDLRARFTNPKVQFHASSSSNNYKCSAQVEIAAGVPSNSAAPPNVCISACQFVSDRMVGTGARLSGGPLLTVGPLTSFAPHAGNDLLSANPNANAGIFEVSLSLINRKGPDLSFIDNAECDLMAQYLGYAGNGAWMDPPLGTNNAWSPLGFEYRKPGISSPTPGRSYLDQINSVGVAVSVATGDLKFSVEWLSFEANITVSPVPTGAVAGRSVRTPVPHDAAS